MEFCINHLFTGVVLYYTWDIINNILDRNYCAKTTLLTVNINKLKWFFFYVIIIYVIIILLHLLDLFENKAKTICLTIYSLI